MQYALKLHLSAMAPLTIVVAVVEKDSWKRNAAKMGPIRVSPTCGSIRKSPRATKGLVRFPRPKDMP